MKILLIILGVIVGLFVLLVLGLIAASKRIEANTRKENAQLESKYGLPEERRRLLAYGAVLALYRVESPRILHLKVPLDQLRVGLESAWGIANREDALNTLEWLLEEGHRARYDSLFLELKSGQPVQEEERKASQECFEAAKKVMSSKLGFTNEHFNGIQTIAAWDYDRAVNIARWSYALDYISEEELWSFIKRAAEQANRTYNSWVDYFIAFAFGRGIAYHGDIYDIVWKGKELLQSDPNSIWKEFEFKLAA